MDKSKHYITCGTNGDSYLLEGISSSVVLEILNTSTCLKRGYVANWCNRNALPEPELGGNWLQNLNQVFREASSAQRSSLRDVINLHKASDWMIFDTNYEGHNKITLPWVSVRYSYRGVNIKSIPLVDSLLIKTLEKHFTNGGETDKLLRTLSVYKVSIPVTDKRVKLSKTELEKAINSDKEIAKAYLNAWVKHLGFNMPFNSFRNKLRLRKDKEMVRHVTSKVTQYSEKSDNFSFFSMDKDASGYIKNEDTYPLVCIGYNSGLDGRSYLTLFSYMSIPICNELYYNALESINPGSLLKTTTEQVIAPVLIPITTGNTTMTRIVNVTLLDNSVGIKKDTNRVVARYKDLPTTKSDDQIKMEILMTKDVSSKLAAHNKTRETLLDEDILNRTGNEVKLRAIEVHDLTWTITTS